MINCEDCEDRFSSCGKDCLLCLQKQLSACEARETELRQKLHIRDERLVHYQTELSTTLEREKVLEEALNEIGYYVDHESGRIARHALSRVKAMREGK